MTGVGGRPEVIIEGSNNMNGGWKEYNFQYKPGNITTRLPIVGEDCTLIVHNFCGYAQQLALSVARKTRFHPFTVYILIL